MLLLMPAIAKVAAVSDRFGLWFFPLQLLHCLWWSFQSFLLQLFFKLLPFSSSSKANGLKWNHRLMWKSTKDTRAVCGLLCDLCQQHGLANTQFPPQQAVAWGDSSPGESGGKVQPGGFCCAAPQIIYSPCRRAVKSLECYFPSQCALSFYFWLPFTRAIFIGYSIPF